MIGVAVGLALPVGTMALWLRRVDRDLTLAGLLAWSLPLGTGAASVVWWALLPLGFDSRAALAGADAIVWIGCAALLVRRSSRARAPAAPMVPSRPSLIPATLLVLTASLAAASFAATSAAMPHGEWDAWAIWNLRARFLYLGYPDHWRDAFSAVLVWSHVEYPLMLPLTVARAWTYAGIDDAGVPVLIAAVFSLSIVTVAFLSLRQTRSASLAALAAAAILASPAFVRYAPSQCADIPLAFFVLATCIWIARALDDTGGHSAWYVAGGSAGLAAWTKNEGILFLGLALVVVAGISAARRGAWWQPALRFAAGAAPVVAALAALKGLGPPNEIAASLSLESLAAGLGDAARVNAVADGVARGLWRGGSEWIGVLPIVAGFTFAAGVRRSREPGPLIGLGTAALLVAGYAAVYVVTPYDVAWHMRTSIDRVLLHAFPTLVWAAMMLVRA